LKNEQLIFNLFFIGKFLNSLNLIFSEVIILTIEAGGAFGISCGS